jgi:hypothetical protein
VQVGQPCALVAAHSVGRRCHAHAACGRRPGWLTPRPARMQQAYRFLPIPNCVLTQTRAPCIWFQGKSPSPASVLLPKQPSSSPGAPAAAPEPAPAPELSAASSPTKTKPNPADPEPTVASSPTKTKPNPADPELSAASSPTKTKPDPADPEPTAGSSPTKAKPAPAAADTTATDAKSAGGCHGALQHYLGSGVTV